MRYEDIQQKRAAYAAANKMLVEQQHQSEALAAEIRKSAQRSWHLGGNVVMHFVAPLVVPPLGAPLGIHFTSNKQPGTGRRTTGVLGGSFGGGRSPRAPHRALAARRGIRSAAEHGRMADPMNGSDFSA